MKHSKFKRIKKAVVTLFLTTNLTLVGTGSAVLNTASDSANLDDQATPSASNYRNSTVFSPLPSPQEQLNQPNTEVNKATRTYKIDPTGGFIEDELIVKFKNDVSSTIKEFTLSTYKAGILRENRSKSLLIKVSPSERGLVMASLAKDPNVEYVQVNQVGKVQEGSVSGGSGSNGCPGPNPDDWWVCHTYLQWGLHTIQAPAAWLFYKGSSSVKVAVIDSGVDYRHRDLGVSPTGRVIKGPDILDNDNDPIDEDYYNIGHGTGVAGIMAAKTNNGQDIAAVDWYSQVVAIRVANIFGITWEGDVADAIFSALDDYNVDVINLSLSFPNNNPELQNAIAVALNRKVTVVAAVKSSSVRNCFMEFPAAYYGVISVAATSNGDGWWSGCTGNNKGNTTWQRLQVTAPGKEILTLRMNNGVGYSSGTSMATAFVSGVATVLRSCTNPSRILIGIIYGTDDLGSQGWDSTYGYGRLNMYKALDMVCF